MGWDEKLFGWASDRVRRWRLRPDPEHLRRRCAANPLLPRLRLIASAVAERDVAVAEAPGAGGAGGGVVLVPSELAVADTTEANERLYVLRAAFAGMVVRAGLYAGRDGDVELLSEIPRLESALRAELPAWGAERDEWASVLLAGRPPIPSLPGREAVLEAVTRVRLGVDPAALRRALPPIWVDVFDAFVEKGEAPISFRDVSVLEVPLWGKLLAPSDARSVENRSPMAARHPESGARERKSRPRLPPKVRRLDDRSDAENPLTHSFEKVHTAEEHKGGSKRVDGADELDAHHAALEELELDEVVLSATSTQSVYHSDALSLGRGGEAEPDSRSGLRYDEWDGSRRRYLPDYCHLSVVTPKGDARVGRALGARVARDQRRATERLRQEMLRIENALCWRPRQVEGPEIDLDAIVEREASLRAGHEGPDRLYVARRRRGHDLAVLLLVDASMSTDGWVGGRRVLDVEREAAVVLSLALEHWIDDFGVGAFMSFTHDDCRFLALKDFSEPWATGLARLATLEPAGYTRIGPALRHGTELLASRAAKRKLLLLLTDGKPTDTDRYEGRHGESDVRQAVREARRAGVDVFAFAVDPRARRQLPAMFGSRNFAGLDSPENLAVAAARLCARLRDRV